MFLLFYSLHHKIIVWESFRLALRHRCQCIFYLFNTNSYRKFCTHYALFGIQIRIFFFISWRFKLNSSFSVINLIRFIKFSEKQQLLFLSNHCKPLFSCGSFQVLRIFCWPALQWRISKIKQETGLSFNSLNHHLQCVRWINCLMTAFQCIHQHNFTCARAELVGFFLCFPSMHHKLYTTKCEMKTKNFSVCEWTWAYAKNERKHYRKQKYQSLLAQELCSIKWKFIALAATTQRCSVVVQRMENKSKAKEKV